MTPREATRSGAAGLPDAAVATERSQRLAALLQRIGTDADFPALSQQVRRVQMLSEREEENLHRLADEILQDVALTQKLLRWVNAAPYVAHRGGVATVSRAISLLGMGTVKGIAASLMMLEHWGDREQAGRMQDVFARSLLAAHMAAELLGTGVERESVFLAALFQGLGRMLTVRFLPELAQRIEAEAQGDGAREAAAALRHLGVSYDELALAVARMWGFPAELQRTMERPRGPVPARPPTDRVEWQRWVAAAGSDLADAWLLGARDGHASALERLANRYAHLVDKTPEQVVQAAQQAHERMGTLAKAVGLRWKGAAWRAEPAAASGAPVALPPAAGGDRSGAAQSPSTVPADVPPDAAPALVLAQGLFDATAACLDGLPTHARLELVLEIMLRALRARRAWVVAPQPGVEQAAPLACLGPQAETLAAQYRVASRPAAGGEAVDLLVTLGRMTRDSWLQDVTAPKIAARLPAWYRAACTPGTSMIVLPLWRGERWLGWLHLDGSGIVLPELGGVEHHLVRALRNLAGLALVSERTVGN